jgi:hypothetical protein
MHYLRRLVVILLAVGLLVSIPGLNPVRAQKAEEPPFRLPFLDPPGASTWLLGQAYSALTLDESGVQAANAVELARGGRLRDAEISPDGKWLVCKVANGDWSISPDGGRVVFISALDRNIWVLDLPAAQ